MIITLIITSVYRSVWSATCGQHPSILTSNIVQWYRTSNLNHSAPLTRFQQTNKQKRIRAGYSSVRCCRLAFSKYRALSHGDVGRRLWRPPYIHIILSVPLLNRKRERSVSPAFESLSRRRNCFSDQIPIERHQVLWSQIAAVCFKLGASERENL